MHREYDPSEMSLGQAVSHGREHDHGPDHSHEHDRAGEFRRLQMTALIVAALVALHLLTPFLGTSCQQFLGLPWALWATVIGGGRIVYLALAALFEGRIGADIALAIACVAAAVLGEYFVAAEVVLIALVGECLEALAFGRAQGAIRDLLDLSPATARVLRDGREIEIPVGDLAVGELFLVRPGERLAADGLVVSGRSSVDQSPLTGEGLPVDKDPGDPVHAGTINIFGLLHVRAERVGSRTTLGQVLLLLAEAQRKKSRLERTADRYARRFLPAVLLAALVVFVGTNLSALGALPEAFRSSGSPWLTLSSSRLDVMPALAVLVVACPCALILATPTAVLAVTARLARQGVLVKGGAAIERLAAVNCLAFDKTGTLTEGRPELADRVTFGNLSADEVLRLAAAVEHGSEHPLARLVVAEARRLGMEIPTAADFQAHPGAGVEARVEGHTVFVGNLRLVRERGLVVVAEVNEALAAIDRAGQTALLLAVDGQIVGAIGARDRVRREAHSVVRDLKHLGITDLTILTGDRAAAAAVVAKQVHIDVVRAEQTPIAKAEWAQEKQREGRVVAVVGDGINDAPALALADVGIAVGGMGADIAAEAGSVVLMGEPLRPLPDAIALSRRAMRIIRQNILVFAFGLNAVAVVLAGLRVLGPVSAAIVHQIGSLLVILNAVRLLGFEGWGRFGVVRVSVRAVQAVRSFRVSDVGDWAAAHARPLLSLAAITLLLGYLSTGLVLIGPDQVGLLQRWGRYRPPVLGPGLHVRWPIPMEVVTLVEPGRVRVARVGLTGTTAAVSDGSVAWSASHGTRRADAALFLTGDEQLVELAAVVEYHLDPERAKEWYFGVAAIETAVQAAAEGVFRETVGRATLDELLVADRGHFEESVRDRLESRSIATGVPVVIERARVVDAHPPREVVPAYRDVAAAVSDAARFENEAQGYAAEQKWAAEADAQAKRAAAATESHRMQTRAEGEKAAFVAQQVPHAKHPELTDFRLLQDALAVGLADRNKILLDPRVGGRRQLWLTGPEQFGLGKAASFAPLIPTGGERPED